MINHRPFGLGIKLVNQDLLGIGCLPDMYCLDISYPSSTSDSYTLANIDSGVWGSSLCTESKGNTDSKAVGPSLIFERIPTCKMKW